jgi:hypothetical protein
MAANTAPIYGRTPDLQVGGAIIGPSANTATDGTGANTFLIYTADATEGSFVQYVRFKPVATIAATVIRVWYCSATGTFTAGTTNTAANTGMLGEIAVSAFTASNTTSSPSYDLMLNLPMLASTKLLATFGTSTGAAGNGFNPITVAMKY